MTLVLPAPPAPSDEPPWLAAARRVALERLEATPFPTVDEEEWRYSPIASLDPARFGPADGTNAEAPTGLRSVLAGLPPHAGGVVLVDGRVHRRHLDADLAARGVSIGPLVELPGGDRFAEPAPDDQDPPDLFATAAVAFAPEPVVIHVPAGVAVEAPLVVVNWSQASGTATYGRVIVDLAPDAEATVLDVEVSSAVEAFRSATVDLRVGAAGRLRYVNHQQLGDQIWRIATHRAEVGQEASLDATQIALGGRYVRTRAECRLVGRGGTGDLLALFFGTGDQVLDFRTFQHHEAPDTTSNLLFKGAVADHARSVYTGLIRVHENARGTNAFQTNRNIKLSEHAWADSVPNLEIENNDVRCSHASTVGPVDEEQQFYLESRGIPPRVAERLIVTGFFEEVLQRLPVPELATQLRAELSARLEAIEELA
jgi:Fe-S cluster assembly protein SufD